MNRKLIKGLNTMLFLFLFWVSYVGTSLLFVVANGGLTKLKENMVQTIIDFNLMNNAFLTISFMLGLMVYFYILPFVVSNHIYELIKLKEGVEQKK